MEPIRYVSLWVRRAFHRSLGIGDFISSVVGNAVTVAVHFHPAWRSSVSDLVWQIPVFGLAGAMAWRIIVAPYELWKEQKARADAAAAGLHLDAESASISFKISPGSAPVAISLSNIHAWHSRTLSLSFGDAEGNTISKKNLGAWFFALWFDRPIHGYQVLTEIIAGDPIHIDISGRESRGIFFTADVPNVSTVIEIKVEKTPNA